MGGRRWEVGGGRWEVGLKHWWASKIGRRWVVCGGIGGWWEVDSQN